MGGEAKKPPYARLADHSARAFNAFGVGRLPGLLGMEMLAVEPQRLTCRLEVREELLAPNGFLHAGSVVAVADSMCGYGSIVNLPDGAVGFTTIELKSNFLGTLREGALRCEATPVHLGRNTHVWDAVVTDEESGRRLAVFRCTQMVLWEKR
jgi:1,4-dihydroxy-2-naphthoyl-CoA hydrolase